MTKAQQGQRWDALPCYGKAACHNFSLLDSPHSLSLCIFFYSFIHICVHYLGHFSPCPSTPPLSLGFENSSLACYSAPGYIYIWWCWRSNPGVHACKASALHWATLVRPGYVNCPCLHAVCRLFIDSAALPAYETGILPYLTLYLITSLSVTFLSWGAQISGSCVSYFMGLGDRALVVAMSCVISWEYFWNMLKVP
jgi:hypothetical protein